MKDDKEKWILLYAWAGQATLFLVAVLLYLAAVGR